MAKEMPPKNFPIDDEGNKICAKCNTRSGCTRPVMDQHNSNLRSELFDVEQLYTFDNMTAWIENSLKNQRCIWGVHKPISKDDAPQFKDWFNRPENNGYKPYDSTFVVTLVKELLTTLYEKAYKNEKAVKGSGVKLTTKQKNDLLYQINGIERAYMDMEGSVPFQFMVDCDRDVARCNDRREFDRNNHQHPYELEGTEIDKETYAEVADLRKKCIDMGIDAKTGPQKDVDKTIGILQKRIDDHANKAELSKASRKKNEERSDIIKENKVVVKEVAGDQLTKHMGNACSANDVPKILSLINRGANANVETPRGMRPLLVVIVNNGNPDQISKLIKGGAYINACNRIGLTALMLACRLRDTRLVHLLLQNGADEVASEGRYGQGRTALHYCALHSAEDEARALYDYTKEGEGEDVMRMARFLDHQDKNGDSPMMVAARNRNGLMCYNLLKMGADPKIMNANKQTAAYIAREYSYTALADFLDTKIGSGLASVETFSDLQFEKVQRFGGLRLMELIQQYCNKILKLLQGRNNVTILMCPSRIQEFADMYGEHEKHQLVNRYFFFVLMQQANNADTAAMIESMKKIVLDIVTVVREGNVYPSAEALEKPLPWTALMCATTINDARSMRLICHEGADPNYQNRHGMTALMLAAQLNNIEAICELLLLGADINIVDNEGFNAYAYAMSLPYAKPLQRSSANVLTDGDNESTKRYTADEVMKMALTLTPVEIKVRVKANLKKCTAIEIKNEMGRLKLLEKNGLSKVKTDHDVQHSAASSHWRIDPEASLTLFGEDCYGDSDKKISVQDAVKKIKAQEKKKGEKPRCPICTLALPCKHFRKEAEADVYARKKERDDLLLVEKKKAQQKRRNDADDEDEDEDEGDKHPYKERSNALYDKEESDVAENENLLMQLEIEKERAQILSDRLDKEENETDGLNNLPPRTPIKVKLRRQLHEEQQKSKELASKLEEKKNAREKENIKNSSKAKDYADSAKKGSNKHPHTPVTSKLLKELEDEKQKALDLAEELDRVKSGDVAPKTPELRAKVRKELEEEKNRTKSLETALDKTKKRIKEDNNSPLKKKKDGKRREEEGTKSKKKNDTSSKKKAKGKASKYTVDSEEEDEEEEGDEEEREHDDDDDGLAMGSSGGGGKNKASKLRKKVEDERSKKEEEIRRKEEKKKAAEKARKEEERRKKKEEAEKKKQREAERAEKEAEKARQKEEARKRKEKEERQRRREEEQARQLAKQAKERADKLKAEQKAEDAKIKKEREKMKVKLLELQARLNKKEIDDTTKHKKSKDKKSLEKSAQEYRRMKKEMEAISSKLNKTSRRANDAENRLEEMVQLMSIKKEIEDHNSKIAEATTRKSTLAKKLLNHMGDAVLYSEAGFSDDAHQYLSKSGRPSPEGKKSRIKHRDSDSDDDDRHHKKSSSKKGKLLDIISQSKKKSSSSSKSKQQKKKRYETSDDDESVSTSESESDLSSSEDGSGSDTNTSIEDVGIQMTGSSDEDSDSDLESVSDLETSASGNETEASGFYDSDGSRPVSRSIIKRDTGQKKYKAKKRVLKFNINNKILTNLPKGETKIKVSSHRAALKRPLTTETETDASGGDSEVESSDDDDGSSSGSGSEVESDTAGEETEAESEIEEEEVESEEEEEDHKKLSRKSRSKMAKWMNKL